MPNYLEDDINHAILCTQYQLHGWTKKWGIIAGDLEATPSNLVVWASGYRFCIHCFVPTDTKQIGPFNSTPRQYLAMCRRFAADCKEYQKDAIRLIIGDILAQRQQLLKEVTEGKRRRSPAIDTVQRYDWWGKVILSLAKAFEFPLTRKELKLRKRFPPLPR